MAESAWAEEWPRRTHLIFLHPAWGWDWRAVLKPELLPLTQEEERGPAPIGPASLLPPGSVCLILSLLVSLQKSSSRPGRQPPAPQRDARR